MMQETIDNVDAVPMEVSADAGYYSAKAVDDLQALGVDRSSRRIRPATAEWFRRRPEDAYPSTCPPGTGCGGSCRPGGAAIVTPFAWRRWSRSSARSRRVGGFRQFLLRGLEKVNGEWSLICTGHNPESSSGQALLKLFRFGRLASG